MTEQEAFEGWRRTHMKESMLADNIWHAALEWARTQQEPKDATEYSEAQWWYQELLKASEQEGASLDLRRAVVGVVSRMICEINAPSMQAIPEGWKLVPEEPTDCMKHAGRSAAWFSAVAYNETSHIYRAMLAAASEYKEEK